MFFVDLALALLSILLVTQIFSNFLIVYHATSEETYVQTINMYIQEIRCDKIAKIVKDVRN